MVGIYFSGTGNTRYCVNKLLQALDDSAELYPIEDERALSAIQNDDTIVFGYPVYYSNLPKIVKDFIRNHSALFRGKKVFIVATMGLFSGDGAGCSARLFKKCGATVSGGLHVKMPDCIGDVKLLKKSLDENRELIARADEKIADTAKRIRNHKFPKDGLGFFAHLAGLFGQRLYYPNKTKRYYTGIKVDSTKCVRCGLCAENCPLNNIALSENKIKFKNQCTTCYRCFSKCPKQAITILGKKVHEQCYIEKYL